VTVTDPGGYPEPVPILWKSPFVPGAMLCTPTDFSIAGGVAVTEGNLRAVDRGGRVENFTPPGLGERGSFHNPHGLLPPLDFSIN
jgi:hypothetical protein